MPDAELAFVLEVLIQSEPRLCVQLPGDDGLAFTAVLERGHAVPEEASRLRFDPAFQPLAFVANSAGGKRLGRFRAMPARSFVPYRAVTGGDVLPWNDAGQTRARQHDPSTLRSAGDGLYRGMLDTGFFGTLRVWPALKAATRRAIDEALALNLSAHDPDRVAVLRRYVEWLNQCDERHQVIDTVARDHLCPAVDVLAKGMGLPVLPNTWADFWRDW